MKLSEEITTVLRGTHLLIEHHTQIIDELRQKCYEILKTELEADKSYTINLENGEATECPTTSTNSSVDSTV